MRISLRRIGLCVGAAILIMAGIGYLCWPRFVDHYVDYKMPGNPQPRIAAAGAAAIERRERLIDKTVWKKEVEAQIYGRVFEDFWDALNAATNRWEVLERFGFEKLILGEWNEKQSLAHGIEEWKARDKSAAPRVDSGVQFLESVGRWKKAGWGIMQCEFRHNAFDPQTNDMPAKSKFYFAAHLTNLAPARAVVEGTLFVEWRSRETNQPPTIATIDASRLNALVRVGPPAFEEILQASFDPPPLTSSIEPLLVYDLDGDGVPEIVLPSLNRLFRKKGKNYEEEPFSSMSRLPVLGGVFADMDGDGVVDFLYSEAGGLLLLRGSPAGKFENTPRALTAKLGDDFGPRTISCGDVDGDGDLDVFVGEYRGPFAEGTMPTPYYAANDGYPSYLFVNDGAGNLRDATVEAGLAAKRWRRVYSASFVDLDADGALDLVVTSDFAGVDVYRNDGHGKFNDVTTSLLDESHLFGMGQAFSDLNNDGRIDFYVAGMQSATAERLEHLGLNRTSLDHDAAMRARMIYGSRLYLQDQKGRFAAGEAAVSLARSGWSWGVSAADFNNDAWQDFYVVNGMESMASVRDYDREFWLHDIFVGNSQPRQSESVYFATKLTRRRIASESYGGYESNRLYLSRGGTNFADVAHLLGVALQNDCRTLVAADLDGDGREDLVFTSEHALPTHKEKLHVYRNLISEQGNWIEFSFREEPEHRSPIGAQVLLSGDGLKKIGAIVTGDSFRSQRPIILHFGLADRAKVDAAEIRWPGGAVTRLAGPQINQAHAVRAPKR